MSRKIGLAALLIGVLLIAQRLILPFDLQTGHRFDGTEVLAVTETCGRAGLILLSPESELAGLGSNFADTCTRRARTRAVESAGVAVVAVGLYLNGRYGRFGRVQRIDDALPRLPSGAVEVSGRRSRR